MLTLSAGIRRSFGQPKAANLTPPADSARHRPQGGDIISESGGDYFSEQGGGIISELGGGFPRNLQAIHDFEGFGGVRIEEYASFESVAELAAFIAEHGDLGAALLDHYSGDIGEAREAIEDRYLGCHASLADYVQELTEETTEIPQSLRYYIDWQAMARDAEMSGDLFTVRTGWDAVHVFAGR